MQVMQIIEDHRYELPQIFRFYDRPRQLANEPGVDRLCAAHDLAYDFDQRVPVSQPQGIGFGQRLLDGYVALAGALVRPDENVPQELDAIELIDRQGAVRVRLLGHVHERERREVVLDQRDVGAEARDALVDVVERLQVGNVHHQEESLLERIAGGVALLKNDTEVFLDPLRYGQRVKDTPADFHDLCAQATRSVGIRQQVLRQQRVQIKKRVKVEADFLRLLDQHFNRRLMVQDHLRFAPILAFRGVPKLDQVLGIEAAVGVAFETARCPREIDQQAVQNVARIGSCRTFHKRRAAYCVQM